MSRTSAVRLSLEALETRENPATETFDAIVPPALPSGWAEWSSDGSDVFRGMAARGSGGSPAVVSSAGSRTAGLMWSTQPVGADGTVAAAVNLNTLVPTLVFARGQNLDVGTGSQSYLAAVVTRGLKVELREVTGTFTRVFGSVQSPGSAYYSGWARVSLVQNGNAVAVQIVRQDTGQYLNAQGTWQAAATTALSGTSSLPASGFAGIGRNAQYAGEVAVDDFTMPGSTSAPPAPVPTGEIQESFDGMAAGAVPTGWRSWSSDAAAPFKASIARSLSPSNGFASNGGSTSAARSWADAAMPADVDASAALYLDSLIPAQLFVRGANLDTASPTYYGLTVARGLDAKLVKVVNGVSTTLATLKSSGYFSSQWLRVRLVAQGDHLQAVLYRADTRQWLAPDGTWSASPDFAFDLRDAGIATAGQVGVGRAAAYSGAVAFDDFAAVPAGAVAGPVVTIQPLANANSATGEATFRASVSGSFTRLEFRLNNQVRATSSTSPAVWEFDTTTVSNGNYTLTVRAFDSAGNVRTADYPFTVNNPGMAPVPKPNIPAHYDHIRIAALAYYGNPMGAFEQQLLRNSVDLVIPNPRYLQTIQNTAPNTPQLIYSNVSNLYEGLLTDWLTYADRTGASRELAFYHVAQATPFSGSSASSRPVNWFWGVYQTTGSTALDLSSKSRGTQGSFTLGAAGTATSIGYPDRFRELNVAVARGAGAGWSGVWEYASAADAAGKPSTWKSLTLKQDGTNGLKQSGAITFDPPADWTASAVGGTDRLFNIRFRATAGTTNAAPEVRSFLGRDYVKAMGGTTGTIPAFDYAADADGDGYLNDAEFAGRTAGKDARFIYESRLFYPYYGQMRFVTDPSASAVRKWAADYHVRLLNANPLADGVMMDNSIGKVPFAGTPVLEPTNTYSDDLGALVGAVNRAIAPRWVLANTVGGREEGTPIAAGSGGVLEEFLLRPLDSNWSELGDAANLVALRLHAPGNPYVVLDSLPTGGSPTDPRMQLATLAYYYLLADPDRTFLMFYGGFAPASSWTQHWTAAVGVDVGDPTGTMRTFATGADPTNAALTYKVFARDYAGGLVLYKPLSYAAGRGNGTLADATATTHSLGGNYRVVQANGTLGPVVNQIALRNGEGAVLVEA